MKSLFVTFVAFAVALTAEGEPSLAKPAQRRLPPWPPTGSTPLRVIIDTDAANEVDDQWAIALALGFPDKLKIEGFVAAHYGQRGGAAGIGRSRAMIEATLAAADCRGKYVIHDGSDPLPYRDRLPPSPGVEFILSTARGASPDNPVWLLLLGPATDGAIALLKEPQIADRLVIFWHGRSNWPQRCANFNATNDPIASQLLFELPCRYVLFDTGTHLTLPMPESEARIGGAGKLGRFLHELRRASSYASRPDKGMFDLGDIAALIEPAASKWEAIEAPGVQYDQSYDFQRKNGPMVRIYDLDRERTFALLEAALARVPAGK